ncbi:thioredoxin family protein, partial [Candidatus Riflebacteria bacterium]
MIKIFKNFFFITWFLLLPTISIFAAEKGWLEDFEAAKSLAQKEGKDLLVDFSGSDWCGWCIKLSEEVFSQEIFKKEAAQKFVFVLIDFPQKKEQSQEVKNRNKKLAQKFAIRGYPT